jgi:hypothetical protein
LKSQVTCPKEAKTGHDMVKDREMTNL